MSDERFSNFWASWYGGVMRFGYGMEIGRNVIIEKTYNSTLDIKFLALLNAFGSAGEWQVYAGIPWFI